jgi:type IV secretion system protein VirB10
VTEAHPRPTNVAEGAGDRAHPAVDLPPAGLPLPVVLLIFVVLGGGLFAVLNSHRHQLQVEAGQPIQPSPARQLAQAESIPPLAVPQAPPPPPPAPPPPPKIEYVIKPGPPPPPVIQYIERPGPAPPPASFMPPRAADPALVLDLGGSGPTPPAEEAAVTATVLRNRTTLVPEGTLIPAVLETPINSTRPGPVPGQKRVLVTWNRLVRPDGVAIRLTSPSADTMGGVGTAGHVDNHLPARLTSAVLQTALVVGTTLAGRPGDGGVVVSVSGQSVATAAQPLFIDPNIKPTIKVKPGAAITVFVARDLDFSGTINRP